MIDLGWAQLALKHKDAARAAFERALAHPKAGELTVEIGDAKFGLAQLVFDDDPARAVSLAREARTVMQKTPGADHLAELERWLIAHERLR